MKEVIVEPEERLPVIEVVKGWDTNKLIDFLRKQKLMLEERHFKVLREQEITGPAFLLMNESKFGDCGFKLGPIVVLTDIVNRIK